MRNLLRKLRRDALQRTIEMLDVRRRRLLAWRSLIASDVLSISFVREGVIWSLAELDGIIGFFLFVEGGYQGQEIRALLEWLRCNDVSLGSRTVVVDVGANIGTTSIPFARQGGYRVVAIEPASKNFRQLEVNVASNGLQEQILLAHRAVLRGPGTVTMCVLKENFGGSFVWRDGLAEVETDTIAGYETVEGDELETIIKSAGIGLEEVALVWADVQGCEGEVIDSGARLWAGGVPLWAEVEPLSLARQGRLDSFEDLAAAHFDRFVDSHSLLKLKDKAPPRSIAALGSLIRSLSAQGGSTDILLLPPSCKAHPLSGRPSGTHEPVT
jgi:FkbM family methyltransferase